jgi:ABC-type amino acid transport substrate-binding protein
VISWSFGIVLLVVSGIYLRPILLRPQIEDRVYTIGVSRLQEKSEDGSPTGLAIELIREAAKSRGIRLKWVTYPGSAEEALRNRHLDLWSRIVITPERQREKAIYISKPYFQHDYHLLVLAASEFFQVSDMHSASISHPGPPKEHHLLHSVLPRARLLSAGTRKATAENMCSGRSDAAFLDEVSIRLLLLSGFSCASQTV